MQITKAMELVATSKLRRAKERAEATRPYFEAISGILSQLCKNPELLGEKSPFGNGSKKTLFVVIAGDRGLAGGYNANVFRLAKELAKSAQEAIYLPIGKKSLEYYSHRGADIFAAAEYAQSTGVGKCCDIARRIYSAYEKGEIGRVVLVYTHFASMISQLPVYENVLPLECDEKADGRDVLFDTSPEEMLPKIMPDYIGGVLYSALCESVASECGARRSAMNSANKNASEMIDVLMLKYNRARQAVITQEITEIVSGAEAL